MYTVVNTLAPSFLIGSSLFLKVRRTNIKTLITFNFSQIRPWTADLAALERLENSQWTYNGINVVTALAPSFSNGSSSFLQVKRITIKAWMSLIFCQIQQLTTELAALECLKNQCFHCFSVVVDLILFIVADNKEMNNILDVSIFWPDWTTDNRVSCP